MEKYYKDLLKMPAVKSTKNPDGTGTITESTVNEIHKVLRSCFRQAVKWDMMEKNPAVDATVPKAKNWVIRCPVVKNRESELQEHFSMNAL